MQHPNTSGTNTKKLCENEAETFFAKRGSKTSATSSIDKTFLATGFGLRNVESLERALREEERKIQEALWEHRKHSKDEQSEEEYVGSAKHSGIMVC